MTTYSKKAQGKIGKVMHEWKEGTLKSGSGHKVRNRNQAIAIGISEARAEGDKVPKNKPRSAMPTKTAAKKSTVRKRA